MFYKSIGSFYTGIITGTFEQNMTSLNTQFLQNTFQNAPQAVFGPAAQKSLQKSDLLQKYLERNSSPQTGGPQKAYVQGTVQQNVQTVNIQKPVQTYIPSSTMQIPSVLNNGVDTNVQKDPKKMKKAKIAAFSLGVLVLGTAAAILGATKSGRGAVRAFTSFIQTNLKTFFADFSKKHNSEWADKIYKNLHKLSVESDNASGGLENFTNGKDIFCRHIAENLSGFKVDGTQLPPSNNKIVQFVRDKFGGVFKAYHRFDNRTTGFYKSKVDESTLKRYSGAFESFEDFKNTVTKALSNLSGMPNAEKTIMINGKETKVTEAICEVEKMLQNIEDNLNGSFSPDKIMERLSELTAYMMDDGNGASLTEKATASFMEAVRGKNIKSLFAKPVAGSILRDKKAAHASLINGFKGKITNDLNAIIGENRDVVAGLRKFVNPDDIESVRNLDDIIKTLGKLKKTNLDTASASKEALDTIFAKLDNLKASLSVFNANGAADGTVSSMDKIVQTLDEVQSSISNVKAGETEEMMGILKQILEPETYVDIVKPGMKRFRGALNRACSLEMNDTFDKLRDVNCGSAPTDIGGIVLSTALLGLYTAQADDKDERVGVMLTTGVPILSTMGTCLFAAINQISGKKALLLGSGVAFITKTICDGLNKIYRKHQGLDENAKPSIVTIDDYINDYINPYINKFEQVFFEPVNGQGTVSQQMPKQQGFQQ